MPAISIPPGLRICERLSDFVTWITLVNQSFRLTIETIEDETGITIDLPGVPPITMPGLPPITVPPLPIPSRPFGATTIPETRGYVGNVFPTSIGGGARSGRSAARDITGRTLPGGRDTTIPGVPPTQSILSWLNLNFDLIHRAITDSVDVPFPTTIPLLDLCDDEDRRLVEQTIAQNLDDVLDAVSAAACPACAVSPMGSLLQPILDEGPGSRWRLDAGSQANQAELSITMTASDDTPSPSADSPYLDTNAASSPHQINCATGNLVSLDATVHLCAISAGIAPGDIVARLTIGFQQQFDFGFGLIWVPKNADDVPGHPGSPTSWLRYLTRAELEAAPDGLAVNVAAFAPAFGANSPPMTILVSLQSENAVAQTTLSKFCDLNLSIT